MSDLDLFSTVVVRSATTPIRLGDELLGGSICAASVGNLLAENEVLEAELAKLRTELGDGTTGNKYRAELYDEVWQKARDMGFGNVTNALSTLEVQRAEQWSLRREAEAKVDTQAAIIAELQAELARLRAGQEPVAYITGQFAGRCVIEAINRAAVLPTGMALYTAPQPGAVPDAVTMADVMRAWEYAEDHPHKYLRGTTNWCAAVAYSLNQRTPSAPATVQGVSQQLIKALEAVLNSGRGTSGRIILDAQDEADVRAAIAAARKEGGRYEAVQTQ